MITLDTMAPLMFGGLIVFMLIGYPVAFSLGAVGLLFGYIGIEMGDHAITHCVPRLQKVIEGEQGGISEAVGWKGGSGYRFYSYGDSSLLWRAS